MLIVAKLINSMIPCQDLTGGPLPLQFHHEALMSNKMPTTARSLPIALIRAREGVMLPIRDMLSETGITEQQWRVMRVLWTSKPMNWR